MQRKLTPLQRLSKEFPHLQDTVLRNELDRVGGDIRLAIEQLKPLGVSPSTIPEQRNSSESPNASSSSITMSSSDSFSNIWNWQATPVIPTPSIVEWYLPAPISDNGSACCIEDIPIAEATFCSNAEKPHRFCFTCARRYAEEEIGKTKFKLVCFDGSGCASPFSDKEIKRFLDERTYEFLEELKMAQELKEAGLEGLVHCPFCSFAAIMEDPTDRIFVCLSCGVSSCRYCRVKSHHPVSCEKYQANKKLSAKHIVEEAMTDALVRKCNKCKKSFLKEEGCNKMKCSCGNQQCYVCSEDVTDYSHFGDEEFGRCPMYGDIQDKLRSDVDKAEEATVQQLLRDRSDLKDEDVRVNKNVDHGDRETEGRFLEGLMADLTIEQQLWVPEPANEIVNRELYEAPVPFYYAPFERPEPLPPPQFIEPLVPPPPSPARWPLPPLYWPAPFTYPHPPPPPTPPHYGDERPAQPTNTIIEEPPPRYQTIYEPPLPAPTHGADGFDNRSLPNFVPVRKRGQKPRRRKTDWQPRPPSPLPPVPINVTWPWRYDQPNYTHVGRSGEASTSVTTSIPNFVTAPNMLNDVYIHPGLRPNRPSNHRKAENTEQKQKSQASRKLTRKTPSQNHHASNNNFKSNNPFLKPHNPNASRNPYNQFHTFA